MQTVECQFDILNGFSEVYAFQYKILKKDNKMLKNGLFLYKTY